ncbi:MAG: hypothetical protein JNK37_14985 [Verrucomicrobiales bacterium]|nr:hypothetical protein [Verrucomicrobiales bacterium]
MGGERTEGLRKRTLGRFNSIRRRSVMIMTAAAILSAPLLTANAQPHTPARGSAERTAILDPVRRILESEINQRVVFVVDHLKVDGSWAFFKGTPQTRDGKPINYRGTRYEQDSEEADEITVALLGKVDGRWTVIQHGFFTTDVWWHRLWERVPGCPSSIFDH